MGESLDIKSVINQSTSQVSLNDLTRKGVKRVKVLNQETITRLIAEAVDGVIRSREQEVTAAQRDKFIQESKRAFENMARDRLAKERSRAEELEHVNRDLSRQVEDLKHQIEGSDRLHAEIDGALAKLRDLESDRDRLQALLKSREEELEATSAEIARKDEALAARDAEIRSREQEAAARAGGLEEREAQLASERRVESDALEASQARHRELEESLARREEEVSRLQDELETKDGEIDRLTAVGNGLATRLMTAMSERESESKRQVTETDVLKESFEELRQTLADLVSRGGLAAGSGDVEAGDVDPETLLKFAERGDDVSVESNIAKVKVKARKAKGVNDSLARLKQLRGGA